MGKRTEYLVTQFDRDENKRFQLRVPKGADIRLLLERLMCRELDDEVLIASCLRKNAKRAYDPFQIIDMREDYKREQAKAALDAEHNTADPIGVYNRARRAPIPLGKTLLFAGVRHEYSVREVETGRAQNKLPEGHSS